MLRSVRSRKASWQVLPVIGAAMLLCACQAGGINVPSTGKYMDALQQAPRAASPPVAEQVAIRPFLLGSYGIVREPTITAYAETILSKLEAGWPGPKPAARVYLVACDGFNAEAGEAGAVSITTGVLDYFRKNPTLATEENLAFILAHELAHVLLGHPGDRATTSQWMHRASALVTVGSYFAGAGKAAGSALGPAQYALLSNLAGIEIADGAMFPSWGRAQELQADALAIDLLARAGYAVSTASDITDALEKGVAEAARAKASHRADIIQVTSNSISIVPGAYLKDLWSSLGDTHPEAGDRSKRMRDYVSREYDELMVPLKGNAFQRRLRGPQVTALLAGNEAVMQAAALNTAGRPAQALQRLGGAHRTPLAASSVHAEVKALALLGSGNTNAALSVLAEAMRSPDATKKLFILAGGVLHTLGREAEELSIYNAAYDRFQDPQLYPLQLRAMHHLKRTMEANVVIVKCIAEGQPGLLEMCNAATKS